MQLNLGRLIFILSFIISAPAAYANWDKQCLDDCFSTHHDCGYCNYECSTSDNGPPQRVYSDYTCPFTGGNQHYLNNN